MKTILFVTMFLVFLMPLMASGLDSTVNEMLAMGDFTYIDGDKVFMSSTYGSDKMYVESQAYQFVSLCAYYFLAVNHRWDTLSSSAVENSLQSTDCIVCPWTNGYGEALLSIRLSGIYDNFDSDSYEELGEEALVEAILEYVHTNGDRTAISYDDEDEDY